MSTTQKHDLTVATELAEFIDSRALPGTGVDADAFWKGFSDLVHDLSPRNQALLEERDALKAKIDEWHKAHRDAPHDRAAYKAFWQEIGYLGGYGQVMLLGRAHGLSLKFCPARHYSTRPELPSRISRQVWYSAPEPMSFE